MGHEYTIKDLVDAALRKYNFSESITSERVVQAYRSVVGDFLDKLTRSVQYDVQTHTLKVTFASPALKNEISYKKSDLIAAINKRLGRNEVWKLLLL